MSKEMLHSTWNMIFFWNMIFKCHQKTNYKSVSFKFHDCVQTSLWFGWFNLYLQSWFQKKHLWKDKQPLPGKLLVQHLEWYLLSGHWDMVGFGAFSRSFCVLDRLIFVGPSLSNFEIRWAHLKITSRELGELDGTVNTLKVNTLKVNTLKATSGAHLVC